ncbi:hypothetical protein [Pseudoalteromonas ulvae]|nr:hypothetical protein [Pseudoalteromonas ulvae]
MTMYDYETATTAQKVVPDILKQTDLLLPPPRPDGEGWELIQVVKIELNELYLQFFWQRYIEVTAKNKGTKEVKLFPSNIKFNHQ